MVLVTLEFLVAMGVTLLLSKPIQYVSKKYEQWQTMDLVECEKLTPEMIMAPLKLNFFTVSCYARLASIALLFFAITGITGKPFFYAVLRWTVSITALITCVSAFNNRYRKLSPAILIFTVIFNPIVPFHFSRNIWHLIDFVSIILFCFSLSIIKEKSPIEAKYDPKDVKSQNLVNAFCDYVVQLTALHHVGKELFEDSDAQKLMEQTAKQFFLDINRVWIDHFLLEIAKITDPAQSGMNGKYDNFTIANIIGSINWPQDTFRELSRLNKSVNLFRRYILKARNKLLAHYDKNVYLSGKTLGGFPEGEDDKLMPYLHQIANLFHKACFDSIRGDINVVMPGDVLDLKGALERAIVVQ
jgi:hypothetical protein